MSKHDITNQDVIMMAAKDMSATATTLNTLFQKYTLGNPDEFDIAQFNLLQECYRIQ